MQRMNTIEEFLAWRESHSRPSIHFKHKKLSLGKKSAFNKLGGLPHMPEELAWPSWNDQPLLFLAQVDFATLPRIEGVEYPASGQLYFFYSSEQPGGLEQEDAGGWSVLFAEGMEGCVARSRPPELDKESVFKEIFLSVSEAKSYPATDEAEDLDLPDDDWDKLDKFLKAPAAQMFGWEVPLQSPDMDVEAEMIASGEEYSKEPTAEEAERAKDWVLLFQLDSVDIDGMCWGDLGRLYFWIRKQDLAAKRFDRVWCFLQ